MPMSQSPIATNVKLLADSAPQSSTGLILVVEDNELNRNITCRQLKRLGFATETAASGIEAVKLLRGNAKKYTAIVMDYALPGMDGLSTTLAIRNTISKNVPIIGLSASAVYETREKCLRAGMSDFLTKPVNTEQLNLTLTKALHQPDV